MTVRQPFGVVAPIIPWNVPILFLAGKPAPALMAGNIVVIKSSEKAPLTVSCNSPLVYLTRALYLIKFQSAKIATIVEKASFPPGVIGIISRHGKSQGTFYPITWMFAH